MAKETKDQAAEKSSAQGRDLQSRGFNAVTRTLSDVGWFLPFSVRARIANAVIDAVSETKEGKAVQPTARTSARADVRRQLKETLPLWRALCGILAVASASFHVAPACESEVSAADVRVKIQRARCQLAGTDAVLAEPLITPERQAAADAELERLRQIAGFSAGPRPAGAEGAGE